VLLRNCIIAEESHRRRNDALSFLGRFLIEFVQGNRGLHSVKQMAALRAAAQAVAAITYGAELCSLSLEGIEVRGAKARGGDVLGDIAVWVVGVTALDRYRFGSPAGTGWTVDFNYDDDQRHDLGEAARLAADADPKDDRDLVYAAWVWATDLMADESAWAAIESLAELIENMAARPTESE
jgi:hypothetical protein